MDEEAPNYVMLTGSLSMLGEGEGREGLNHFLTNTADDLLHLAIGRMIVRLCGPQETVHGATCGPRASVCPPSLPLLL